MAAVWRKTLREIWNIAGRDFTEPTRSERIDKFLNQSKQNPEYADSLVDAPKSPPEEKPVDLHALTPAQLIELGRHGLGGKKKTDVSLPARATDVIVFESDEAREKVAHGGLK